MPVRIADQIMTAKQLYAGTTTFLFLLNHDGHFASLKAELFPSPDTCLKLERKNSSTPYSLVDYGPLVENLRNNPQFNLDYLGLLLQAMVIQIGDALQRNDYFDKTPELEFYRHLRNALGHGNVFYFSRGEPRRLASFKGRTLTNSLHGSSGFFNFMAPGDVFELWDYLEKYLRALAPMPDTSLGHY